MNQYKRIYAVDFDGTLAETKFPEIIAPISNMIDFCKELKKDRNNILILWTCRCGEDLAAAVEFCRECGLEFDLINENVPENVEKFGNDSRKIFAHVYIDDKAVNPEETFSSAAHCFKKAVKKLFIEVENIFRKEG